MISPKFVFRLLLLAAGVATGQDPAPGGDPGEEGKPGAKGRVAWILTVAIPDGLDNPATIMAGGKLSKLILSKRSVTEPVKIPGDGIIRMVREEDNPADPSQKILKTLAQAQVPEGISKALIILVPAPPSESGLMFRSKVQDLAGFKGGDTLYMNLSPRNLMVRIGEAKVGLKPGDINVWKSPTLTESVNTPVSYHFYSDEKKTWQLISASTIVLRPTRREVCIFSWDPRFNRLSYHGVTFPVTP